MSVCDCVLSRYWHIGILETGKDLTCLCEHVWEYSHTCTSLDYSLWKTFSIWDLSQGEPEDFPNTSQRCGQCLPLSAWAQGKDLEGKQGVGGIFVANGDIFYLGKMIWESNTLAVFKLAKPSQGSRILKQFLCLNASLPSVKILSMLNSFLRKYNLILKHFTPS